MTIASLFFGLASAFGASLEDAKACLDRIDTECAEKVVAEAGATDSKDPQWLALMAQVHFHEGDYPSAFDKMKAAVDAGFDDPYEELPLYERTMYATAGWAEERRDRFAVRFRPGLDAMLIEDAFGAILGSDKHIAPLLGGSPPGVSRVELYPDGRSFIAASSLKAEDVETTGVVGLAKWSRLLVTSPRALSRGYPWQDTIAHEYIHLVVTHHTADRAPVWMQEAIAKYLDARWRDGVDRFRLSVRQQGLLAEALRQDDLVSFEEMHPSLAKLPTAERASLAYAQLATLMQFSFERGGKDVLQRVLPKVAAGKDPREALAEGVGIGDFAELEKQWRAWIEKQPLVGKALEELPTVLDGGDEMDLDPVLAERQDLARWVTLGDILRKAGETQASLVEYAKAIPQDEPPSPVLSNRIAQAQIELGDLTKAADTLRRSLEDYPEFAMTHKTYGELLVKQGQPAPARQHLVEAVAINPFDPEVHELLVEVYTKLGETASADRHARYLKIRAQGGDDIDRAPIHTREGEYELPTYEERDGHGATEDETRDSWLGKKAPAFSVTGLDGRTLRLADYEGKVLIVDFWATWCGPCKAVMPELAALYTENKAAGLVVLGITDEDTDRVRAFQSKKTVSYPLATDPGKRANTQYEVSALPTAYVIDRNGVVRERVVGAGPEGIERLKQAALKALESER
jgi:peroxiredoxin/tetratricopeptide (TPR) repeat protein